MTTSDAIQWTGIWLVVGGMIVGGIGLLLAELLDISSYVPDAFLLTARIVCPVGVALALIGMVASA